MMFKNYFLLALRKFRKHLGYSLINILGLSLGIACCVLIFSYIYHELNFDNYHKDSERIHRVEFYRESSIGRYYRNAVPGPVGPLLAESSALIETQARLIPPFENSSNVLIQQGEKKFFETDIYFADPQITEILHFEFLQGNAETALQEPNYVILTQSMADKYFPDEEALGKTLNIEIDYDYYCPVAREDFTVTAIIADPPSNTHIPISMMLSMNTLRNHLPWIDEYWHDFHPKYLYVKLVENAEISQLQPSLADLAEQFHTSYSQRTGREWQDYWFYLQPIGKIHGDTNLIYKIIPSVNLQQIRIYAVIALVVLLIGCLNFINISVSIAIKGVKQLGIRKIVGARKWQLVLQCFTESALHAVLSFMLAFCLIELLLPYFNQLTGIQMNIMSIFSLDVSLAAAGLFLAIIVCSGGYNAFVLTNFKTYDLLKGNLFSGGKGSNLQRGLVIVQFTVIIVFLTASFFVYEQLEYMRGTNLGFDKEQKVVIPFKTNLDRLRTEPDNIKAAFNSYPGITGSTVTSGVPGNMSGGYYLTPIDDPEAVSTYFQVLTSDLDTIDEFKLEILAGSKFLQEAENGYILNETGAKLLGFNNYNDIIGKEFLAHYHGLTKKVTGVIKDFHYKGMQEQVKPLVMDIENSLYNTLTLSVTQEDISSTLKYIESTFKELFPGTPFSYSFLDEDFDRLYKHEAQIGIVVAIVALLGIAIAACGLFGLVSLFITQKTKEIGVRKVLGSSVTQLVTLFSSRYTKLVLFAILLAVPLSWYLVKAWLQDFAYRIEINAIPFILASLITLAVAISVVALRCVKAASQNAVEALKYE
jgi:putative ABC transport system permease protein